MQFFRRRTGKWSGPGAELFLSVAIFSTIVFSLKLISRRDGRFVLFRVKKFSGLLMGFVGSGELYTEEYCLERASQISFGEVMRVSFSFRGPTPSLRTLCFLANVKKCLGLLLIFLIAIFSSFNLSCM